jgi:hypothetical protein
MSRISQFPGYIVAFFLAIALYLFGITNALQSLSMLFLLVGLWTIICGLIINAGRNDRMNYVGWGSVVSVLSTIVVLPLAYTIGLVLIVIVALIILNYIIPKSAPNI